MRLKTLPPSALDRLVQGNKPVYVLNSSSLPSGDKGMIVVTFYDGTRREFFKMPPTFIPMAISDAIPKARLAQSRDFKECLVKGILTLVEPESAEDFLATNEAKDEYEALVLSEHSSASRNVNLETEVVKRTRVVNATDDGNMPIETSAAAGSSDSVSNKVRGLIETMISGGMSAKEVLQTLKRHQTALTAIDLSFISQNSSNNELTNWAKATLSQLVADTPVQPMSQTAALAKKGKARASDVQKAERAAKAVSKVTPEKGSAFDFSSKDADMTPEERAADAKARAAAMSQQMVNDDVANYGLEREIDRLLSGANDE